MILLLKFDEYDFYSMEQKKYPEVTVKNAYWPRNKLVKLLRNFFLFVLHFNTGYWLGEWKRNLNTFDFVIIFAGKITPPIVKYINKKYPEKRIVVYFWNPVSKAYQPRPYKSLKCELWSFDRKDCIKYGMRYNPQFYFRTIKLPEASIQYDVLFIGGNKNRFNTLKNIEAELVKAGLNSYIYIVEPNSKFLKICSKNRPSYIPYSEILKLIACSKAILDVNQPNQTGLSLRPMEALFFNKKLITTNQDIINYDFYDRENIFIWDKDDKNTIFDFLEKKTTKLDSSLISFYDFESWLSRFHDNTNFCCIQAWHHL